MRSSSELQCNLGPSAFFSLAYKCRTLEGLEAWVKGYILGPQPLGLEPAPIHGLLGRTWPHGSRWATNKVSSAACCHSPSLLLSPESLNTLLPEPSPSHPPFIEKLSSLKLAPGAKTIGDCWVPWLLITGRAPELSKWRTMPEGPLQSSRRWLLTMASAKEPSFWSLGKAHASLIQTSLNA